jgi:hypothetical protein
MNAGVGFDIGENAGVAQIPPMQWTPKTPVIVIASASFHVARVGHAQGTSRQPMIKGTR